MKNKTLVIIAVCVLLVSCAPSQHNIASCLQGDRYGFLGGLWHGLIAPIAFICSLFMDNVSVWAVNNNGGWYAFGFILGISGSITGSSKA